ncbi:MED14-domain-containing protein [Hypoxylon crocopeplum]|nr:MED14-domain-containing protein [Hypoxylon crocopeplum]
MMPGVVMMENGVRAPLPTNHDRDHSQFVNGNASPERQNGAPPGGGTANTMANGNGNGDGANTAQLQRPGPNASRMNDLPDEIQHIAQGFIPLGTLLSRLAQKTHNQLADEIIALAKMPAPASAVNGNSTHVGAMIDDTSSDNLGKKARLLNFVQEKHAEWVKAAVITKWSRNAASVSKLIDLMFLINMQRAKYEEITVEMAKFKGSLTFARLPNPDLHTALHVLSGGNAPWMPDLNYIEPPPMTHKEQLQWYENLNTLLSLRLNLEDYDNIPYHFRNYTISSGRVTFKVTGEFEVDLTIADEDFDKQFWFIDFRFDFTPAPAELSEPLRMFLEGRVNDVLEKDGLSGCYKFLHEFVLTHKITEFVRQAFELSKSRWVDTLKVERLNRAMSIQYWVGRYPPEGPKSWIILGIHSGKRADASEDPTSTSHLTLRWFRDNKEVKDVEIPLNDADISTEDLLNRVIGKHVGYILSSIYSKLKDHGRFIKRESGIALDVQTDDPTQSSLMMQLAHNYYATVGISHRTGLFSIKPQSNVTWKGEQRLNWQSKDPIQDGVACLEGIRCHYVVDEIIRRGKTTGWFASRGPVKMDVVREVIPSRELGQLMWLKRRGWTDGWYLMVNLSLSGDKWCLVEINKKHPSGEARISSYTQLPLSSYAPNVEDKFFSNLTVFTVAMISHITDMRTLHQRRIKHTTYDGINNSLPANMKIPAIFIRLSDILRPRQSHEPHEPQRRATSWAFDFVQVMFKGIRKPSTRPGISDSAKGASSGAEKASLQKESLHTFLDARLKVSDPSRFGLLKGHVERDVAFSRHLGVFALRLEAGVGSTVLDVLAHRLQAIDKLADCIDAIRRSDRDIQCEEITLTKIVVTYTDRLKRSDGTTAQSRSDRWKATLELDPNGINLLLEKGNPQLRALDLFRNLANSDLRCSKLPFFLSSTLPIQRALNSVEDAWEDLAMNNQGRVEVFAAHLDWFNIHYYLPGSNRNPQAQRRLTLQIRLRERDDGVEWHLSREEPGTVKKPDDEFKAALEKVWNAENKVWRSLVDSAASKTDHHVGDLIRAVDEAIRRLAMQSPTVFKQNQPRGPVQNKAQAMYHKAMATNKARPQQTGHVVILDD